MLGCVEEIEGETVLIGSLIPGPDLSWVFWVDTFLLRYISGSTGGDSILDVTS